MQTVSKTYGAADAEAQAPAVPEQKPLGRATVAAICVAAALSGAAVASVARVRTRAYVADLYAGLGGNAFGPDQLNMKQCGPSGNVCEGTKRCYQKVKDSGETKYQCAEFESDSLGSQWEIAAGASRGTSRVGTSKKKRQACKMNVDPVCDTEGNWHSNACVATKQKFKTISSEHVFVNGLSGPECVIQKR
jgi:hypothetical protein